MVASIKMLNTRKTFCTLGPPYGGQPLPYLGPSLVVFRYPFTHFYFAEGFDYWEGDYDLELCSRRDAK